MSVTKKQAAEYYNVELRNKVMRENGIDVLFYVEKAATGDYTLMKTTSIGNLPESLSEYLKARNAWEDYLVRNKEDRQAWD